MKLFFKKGSFTGIINYKNSPYVFFKNFGVRESRGTNSLLKYGIRARALLFPERSVGVFQDSLMVTKKFATSGFSILEIMMVMAVSAIIMTNLFEIYNQTARNMARVERFVFEDTQILTLKNRFEKDIAGLSAIWFKQAEVEKLRAAAEKKEPSKEFKKCSFYFYSTNKGDRFDTLTFITTSALQTYNKAFDRFVRVVYRLQDDSDNKGLFCLMRKEISPATEFVDEKTLNEGRFYELIGGIKSLDITYQLVDRTALNKQLKDAQSTNKDNVQQSKDEPTDIIRSVKQWTPAESIEKSADKNSSNSADEGEEKKEDLGGAPVPKFVKIKIVFGKTLQQQEQEYILDFYVPSTVDNMPKSIFTVKPTSVKTEQPVVPKEESSNTEDSSST